MSLSSTHGKHQLRTLVIEAMEHRRGDIPTTERTGAVFLGTRDLFSDWRVGRRGARWPLTEVAAAHWPWSSVAVQSEAAFNFRSAALQRFLTFLTAI